MDTVLNVTLPFFALIGCGYAAARLRIFAQTGIPGINDFVWYFALPCMIFRALALRPLAEILDLPYVLGWAAGGWSVYLLTAVLGRLLFKVPVGVSIIQGFGSSLANLGYMGLPMLIALFGETAAVPVVLALLADMLLVQTPTMALLEVARNRHGHPAVTAWRVLRGFVTNPLVLAVAASGLVAGFKLSLPVPVDSFTEILGRAAGPAALFAIGAKLVGQPITDRFGEVALIAAAKLFLHPLVIWAVMSLVVGTDPWRTTIAVLGAALPIGGNLFVVAQSFGIYAARSSTAILVSTVTAVVTFSLLAGWMVP